MFLRNSLLFILLSLLPLACAQVPASPSRSASSNSGAGSTLDLSAFAENPSRWKLLSDLDGIRIYQDQQRIPGRIGLRGKLNANAGIAKVATVFTDLEMRKKWVLGLIEDRILSTRSDFERVEYAKLKSD